MADDMANGILGAIHSPSDVKRLSRDDLHELCRNIRETLLTYGHAHGGHIGSNLGMVEATVALHRVFDSPRDRIVFDVSHQSYVHKMLTGRSAAYRDPSRFHEVTGFTNPEESEHDQFVLGHTGTSISLACGLAKTRDMARAAGETTANSTGAGIGNVIAVIGDGSLSSGIAFEGLNNAAEQGGNLIIIVNDNEMSIAGDFGGMYRTLARLRASNGTAQPNLFNAFGLDYRYVEHGNDVDALIEAFTEVKDIDHPVVVHIHTLKGAGFDGGANIGHSAIANHSAIASHNAIANRGTNGTADAAAAASATGIQPTGNVSHDEPWHSDHCDLPDAEPHEGQCEASHWQTPDSALNRPDDPRKAFGKLAMAALEPRFATEPGLVVISPATPGSNGITHAFRERAGAHYVDTGITESHAVTFACGIAKAGGTPVVATTASFFQRAYDQFFQEMSLNRSRVTILDFLGGLSGSDNTHSGAYDVAMFANIPGITMLVPTSTRDYLDDLAWATMPRHVGGSPDGPVVIRVPGQQILDRERACGHDPASVASALRLTGKTSVFAAAGRDRSEGGNTGGDSGERDAIRDTHERDMLAYRVNHRGCGVAIIALGNTHPLAEQVARELLRAGAGNAPGGDATDRNAIGGMATGCNVTDGNVTDGNTGNGNAACGNATCGNAEIRDSAAAAATIDATVIDPRQCSTLDVATLESLRADHRLVVTLEDGQLEGGWGEKITAYYANHPGIGSTNGCDGERERMQVLNFGARKEFTDRISLHDLNVRYGLTVGDIVSAIRTRLRP
ncbi:1-deoxy-D-xylulose-5-phosphate synthase [Bifidobacterium jacchi]|nr:1-deoxy-D-xylulose-5-phosphate synthase [Bifidobacterium jacchi]